RRIKGVVIRDPEESTATTSKLFTLKLNPKIKAKEDPAVKRYQALKRKPQTEAQAGKNMMLYLKNKTKEQIEEDERRALKRINKTPTEKAAKRQKLDEDVEELKRHLQIVPNKDDNVYTEATPLAHKVPVVGYEIINQNNKPYYKIIRADDSKLIYDLADQSFVPCDMTLRDEPSKGRYREFYQCDFDIAGDESIGADFEVVNILTELLELNIGEYVIKLNHRKLVDGMLDICSVPSNKFRTVCSSIDKLDRRMFEQIKRELIDEKGLDTNTVEKIGSFVKLRGCVDKVVFDLSLARGLDYYTGVIYKAITKGATQVGSIAGGGHYDDLIGTFRSKPVACYYWC
nr:hypothetical protein [Tanacetum cinerariifolium]